MRRFLIPAFMMLLSGFTTHAQDSVEVRQLDSIRITARARLRDMGVQKTSLDSLELRNDITGSLAQVLTRTSTLFIKHYGRATLSTASFRGTSPSHTQVTWNGMKINSPMLGMVDFSTIPSYFVDKADLYHGPGSVTISSGGLGGAIALSSAIPQQDGISLSFIQGAGSFLTFDEFLHFTVKKPTWSASTRVYFVSSRNDYKYINYRKKHFFYDDQGNVSGYEYPVERNKNGSFMDFHVLQDFYLTGRSNGTWNISAWYARTDRGIPLLNVDYKENAGVANNQKDNTFRATAGWRKISGNSKLEVHTGYTYTDMLYQYDRDLGNGERAIMVHSQSNVHSLSADVEGEWYLKKWMFSADISLNQHFVTSTDKAVISVEGEQSLLGYQQARLEMSAFVAARYRPTERLGLSVSLREDLYGKELTQPIPSFFAEFLVSRKGQVTLKASAARNYRYPTLNDLYFMPGGNPLLKPEEGISFDGGLSAQHQGRLFRWSGNVTGFYSRISNWIAWLPTFKGFWSPVNVKQVKSYGIECRGSLEIIPGHDWEIGGNGNFSWTRSLNLGDPVSWADGAIGKQLVYIPEFSAAFTGRVSWKEWTFTYDWTYYSERYTTSSNMTRTQLGVLGPYFMNDIALEKSIRLNHAVLHVKAIVRNLFNEAYETVLARPMPGINYTLSVGIVPLFR